MDNQTIEYADRMAGHFGCRTLPELKRALEDYMMGFIFGQSGRDLIMEPNMRMPDGRIYSGLDFAQEEIKKCSGIVEKIADVL